MSQIPTAIRKAVRLREFERCLRCSSGNAHDIHHRQRRRDGGHTLDNCILLCRTCHDWAHANPAAAREKGFIVSFSGDVAEPAIASWRGWLVLDTQGGLTFVGSTRQD